MIRRPSQDELKDIARSYNYDLNEEELGVYEKFIDQSLASYEKLDQLPEPKLEVRYKRGEVRKPTKEENPYGGWAWMCYIRGSEKPGPLKGCGVAIKDNISVAGVPMLNGSPLMEGYKPDIDATVVTRILDAGGAILGKANNENFCYSSGSHTSYPWKVTNPNNPEFMAGGSSSGSAALVASGEVDMALGCDQAGSIRIPSSACGIYGLKPTWGLVPYTGIMPMDLTIDNVGPMARSVFDIARLLESISGRDGLDPRQAIAGTPDEKIAYSELLLKGDFKDAKDIRIGVLKEGFGWPNISEPDVDEAVTKSTAIFEQLGANVSTVSIPWHRKGIDIWAAIETEGSLSMVVRDNGVGRQWLGYYDTPLAEHIGTFKKSRAESYPPLLKASILLGHYLSTEHGGRYYSKAQNLRRELRMAYDQVLSEYDLLLMPTTPQKPKAFKDVRTLQDSFDVTVGNIENTCPFDVTGHPAMSIPCGLANGLPVGMMLVGRHFDEALILKSALCFERASAG